MALVRCRLAESRTRRRRCVSALEEPVIAKAVAKKKGKDWLQGPPKIEDPSARAEARVQRKLTTAAAFFDRESIGKAKCIDTFEASNRLTYDDFGAMARSLLGCLTKSELAALCALFDPYQSGYIDGADFVRYFLRCKFHTSILSQRR